MLTDMAAELNHFEIRRLKVLGPGGFISGSQSYLIGLKPFFY